ncbi:MAG TPA: ABC transporter ATP-binding protein [Rhodopila sp.]|uniref:ABC transporter ATP-binding protein n=1 Tax=Rhodopila sp. TaxID=2480087 RepID=UPI002CAD3975|nr:ABC transporter ATP-binding protein [Rhodopila sp.]HVY16371.1 ABC transporter ATP-binding protein [Rhodopila sp.]
MLAVSDIRLSFRGVRALDGVSLTIGAGETLGIIGPNGSGKSTLFNVISGIYRPDSGSVAFQGRTITGADPRAIVAAGLARTYQNKRLFGSLTVLENVLVPAMRTQPGSFLSDIAGSRSGRDAGEAKAREALAFVGLDDLADTEAASLAYGQQNRLELARALACDPALLLLDEPAAGLSPSERSDMRGLIERIRDRGVAIALVEHDMRVVMQLSSRLVVLDHGVVIAGGTPAEVTENPEVVAAYFGTPIDD